MTALLSVRHLTKAFGGLTAVRDVSFDVTAGTITALIGPNGAGKTTVFDCVAGAQRPNSGVVLVNGQRLRAGLPEAAARRGIARTFQRLELFTSLTVTEHLVVASRARNGAAHLVRDLVGRTRISAGERGELATMIELVGLEGYEDRQIGSLGLGLCRKVELARALMLQPKILLADESSSGLERHETETIGALFTSLAHDQGLAIIAIEHDLDLVRSIADEVVVLDQGSVLAQGTFDDVMARPRVRDAYLGEHS